MTDDERKFLRRSAKFILVEYSSILAVVLIGLYLRWW